MRITLTHRRPRECQRRILMYATKMAAVQAISCQEVKFMLKGCGTGNLCYFLINLPKFILTLLRVVHTWVVNR